MERNITNSMHTDSLHLAIGSAVTSITTTVYGYITFSNVALIIGMIAGLFSIMASLSTIKKNNNKK